MRSSHRRTRCWRAAPPGDGGRRRAVGHAALGRLRPGAPRRRRTRRHEALSQAVASGAVEALASTGTAPARRRRMVLGEIRRATSSSGSRRSSASGSTRRSCANNASGGRSDGQSGRTLTRGEGTQAAAAAFVRHDLAPAWVSRVRRLGGRTFWRWLDDRVELLHCKAHREGHARRHLVPLRPEAPRRPEARGESAPRPGPL